MLLLPKLLCDVSEKLYRKVHKDCTISVDGSRYEVAHTLVGKKIIVRMKDRLLRVFNDDVLVASFGAITHKRWICNFAGAS